MPDLIKYINNRQQAINSEEDSFLKHLYSYNDIIVPYVIEEHEIDVFGANDKVADAFILDLNRAFIFAKHGYILNNYHQIAHMVEIKKERCLLNDWGLPFVLNFKDCNKLYLLNIIVRETRVRAIQSLIDTYVNQNNKKVIVNSAIDEIINYDFFNKPMYDDDDNRIPNNITIGRFKSLKQMLEWTNHIWDTTISKWNKDRIEHEWKVRADYLAENLTNNK